MKTEPESQSAPYRGRMTALVLVPIAAFQIAAAASSDFLLDEGQRAPAEFKLDANAERQAEAMARFITGMFREESAGPEQAIEDFRKVLELDPGFTKLAIDVAYDYLRRGESAEAISVLKDAAKASPQNADPALALSSIYLRHLRKPDLATRYAEAALEAAPREFGPYEALWEIAQAQGDTRGAMRVLDRAAKSSSASVQFWLQLAEFYASATEGDAFVDDSVSKKIEAVLARAIKAAKGDAEGLARIGDFYVLNRRIEKAVPLYGEAVELKPLLPGINERLAGVLIETGKGEAAIPVLERVIARNPLDLQTYDRLAGLYADRGEFLKAAGCREQALIIDRSNPERYHDLVLLYLFDLRDSKKAIERAAEARRQFPQLPLFTRIHAHALSLDGRHDESMAVFERALVEASSGQPELLDGGFYLSYGIAAQDAGRYVKAAELFQKAIELDPSTAADAYNALGYLWVERGERLDEAEKLIRRALELDPENGAYIDSLGWFFYQQKRYPEALDTLLRASKLLPDPDPVVFDHIGDTYRALGRTAEAQIYWQKASQLDPENKELLAKIDDSAKKVAQKPDQKKARE